LVAVAAERSPLTLFRGCELYPDRHQPVPYLL